MAFTREQIAHAEAQQWAAARDDSHQVRLVAGPGTGKSYTIEKRIAHLLNNGVEARGLYVLSFTRATCQELRGRIQSFCIGQPCEATAPQVTVSTIHALALKILRQANLLITYPSTPILLDDWEQKVIYDNELAATLRCQSSRAAEIRLAYDTHWQTLDPAFIDQAGITPTERRTFESFHRSRTNLYCCVLPGELIHKCVDAFRMGNLGAESLPAIDHLIVDEYQDLNACDQEFIRQLCTARNATLFVAGDDDQSIYSFRHANPDGIVNFSNSFPQSSTHILTDCFRCAPAIVTPATRLIENNPNRLEKELIALYGNAVPPVQGTLAIWSFQSAQNEAGAIAESCRALIDGGMQGHEHEIVILLSNRKLQLGILEQALRAVELPYELSKGSNIRDDNDIFRAVYVLLRLARDVSSDNEDYPAYRDLLSLLAGVGSATAKAIGDSCISNNQNFRELFHLPNVPGWLNARGQAAVRRVVAVAGIVAGWSGEDTLASRIDNVAEALTAHIFPTGANAPNAARNWRILADALPQEMTIDELFQFLAADTEADQQAILDSVAERLGLDEPEEQSDPQRKIRILTMHGAKGLSGKVVFIPSAEQTIIPNIKAIRATGLLIEQRRLFYVSLTRAKACCIVSHVTRRTGADAQMLAQRTDIRMARSQFLDEMQIPSVARNSGLSTDEAASVLANVNNL